LLILDLHLPDISGQEVLARLKTLNPHLPILVYSADLPGMASLRQQQTESPDPRVNLLPKDRNRDAFIRLVPTLFKRRQRDKGPRPAEIRIVEAVA
jgi:CheY-like chemotaxis protein